jgi:hypothetical protein
VTLGRLVVTKVLNLEPLTQGLSND